MKTNYVYVLAWNQKEAEILAFDNVGVDTLEEAKDWLKELKKDSTVDSYYANKYKIFKVDKNANRKEHLRDEVSKNYQRNEPLPD